MDDAVSEQRKYERIWEVADYRKNSPGMRVLSHALDLVKPDHGSSFYDFGCGHGYVVAALERLGHATVGVDIAHNAKAIPAGGFVLANLWDLPSDMPPADHGYCADVMEHLPTDRVPGALLCMASKVRRSIYFQIALFHDNFGGAVGEELHLTVKPPAWWEDSLRAVFRRVASSSTKRHYEAVAYAA